MDEKNGLNPCPFCGVEVEIISREDCCGFAELVIDHQCELSGIDSYISDKNKKALIELWNTRDYTASNVLADLKAEIRPKKRNIDINRLYNDLLDHVFTSPKRNIHVGLKFTNIIKEYFKD